MSLDVYLEEMRPVSVYTDNITHNLNTMAEAIGVYKEVWRPDECGITTANQLIPVLMDGISELKSNPEKYRVLNPPNGWGSYEGLLTFLHNYLSACINNPNAAVKVSR